jgi:hypothetical protein
MRHVESKNIHPVTVRTRLSSGTDDREGHRAWRVSAPELARVGAAHSDVIGTDPYRDARVVTSVTRVQSRACRFADRSQHDPVPGLSTTHDHASDREAVMESAGGKSTKSPARSRRQGRSPPAAGRSHAQSLDAGEHRATLRSRRRRRHAEHGPDVSNALGSCYVAEQVVDTRKGPPQ